MNKVYQNGVKAILLMALLVAGNQTVYANKYEAKLVAQRLTDFLELAGYTTPDSYLTGVLRKGTTYTHSPYLYAGFTYCFAVGGCSDAKDIDVAVYDMYGNEIGADRYTQKVDVMHGAVEVVVFETGYFEVKVRMYDSATREACWVLVMGMK